MICRAFFLEHFHLPVGIYVKFFFPPICDFQTANYCLISAVFVVALTKAKSKVTMQFGKIPGLLPGSNQGQPSFASKSNTLAHCPNFPEEHTENKPGVSAGGSWGAAGFEAVAPPGRRNCFAHLASTRKRGHPQHVSSYLFKTHRTKQPNAVKEHLCQKTARFSVQSLLVRQLSVLNRKEK